MNADLRSLFRHFGCDALGFSIYERIGESHAHWSDGSFREVDRILPRSSEVCEGVRWSVDTFVEMFSNQEAKDELKKWDISLDNGLVEFDGRLLESEQILYANRSIRYKHDEADWSREGFADESLLPSDNERLADRFRS